MSTGGCQDRIPASGNLFSLRQRRKHVLNLVFTFRHIYNVFKIKNITKEIKLKFIWNITYYFNCEICLVYFKNYSNKCIEWPPTDLKVARAANVSVYFFTHNMLGNIKLNVDTTNNHTALMLYFTNPSLKKQSFWKSPTS